MQSLNKYRQSCILNVKNHHVDTHELVKLNKTEETSKNK